MSTLFSLSSVGLKFDLFFKLVLNTVDGGIFQWEGQNFYLK